MTPRADARHRERHHRLALRSARPRSSPCRSRGCASVTTSFGTTTSARSTWSIPSSISARISSGSPTSSRSRGRPPPPRGSTRRGRSAISRSATASSGINVLRPAPGAASLLLRDRRGRHPARPARQDLGQERHRIRRLDQYYPDYKIRIVNLRGQLEFSIPPSDTHANNVVPTVNVDELS